MLGYIDLVDEFLESDDIHRMDSGATNLLPEVCWSRCIHSRRERSLLCIVHHDRRARTVHTTSSYNSSDPNDMFYSAANNAVYWRPNPLPALAMAMAHRHWIIEE
ncbi:hypothetical protein TNCV_5076151 [Trichonephila clavipes]|uniref:Uncharacterized protein n=1 Tax=Trichonephila clavipes TaxID=2585209 RepID=A0A8X6VAT3_TRICX|nr:hypothetical protein TNCV_5076151 [Trichonephila clavipes]